MPFWKKNKSSVDSFHPWKELPGFGEPSVEDLKVEAIKFERSLKEYLIRHDVNVNNKNNKKLIELMEEYPIFSETPAIAAKWSDKIEEFDELREIRNRIVHYRNLEELNLKSAYLRFRNANEILSEFSVVNATDERFSLFKWNENDELMFKIDQQLFTLDTDDLSNLLCQLESHPRGKVNFIRGKMVVAKFHDFYYENITFYVEGYQAFTLSIDETAVLWDILSSYLGEKLYS
ncbi:hypothetical protein J7I00_004435 [Vibrio parahaemolyticus]|nr:hypothetical protein [Vibrio parahaemolyticus]HAV1510846.1 hypothetical protein [Vibrio parahaemolyticus]